MLRRRSLLRLAPSAAGLALGATRTRAQAPAPELYPGERELRLLAAPEGIVVSLNTGASDSNWPAQLAAFRRRYPEIEIVANELGSAATVQALERARAHPVADTAFAFAASAAEGARKGLARSFRPVNSELLPPEFQHPASEWTAVHARAVAFVVNTRLVRGVPQAWDELLRPEYKDSVVYLDPRTTGIGQLTCLAAAFATGGSLENVQPGLDYLRWLHKAGNVLRVLAAPPAAQFLRGEIAIWIAYEDEGLRLKFAAGMGERVAVVVPREASIAAPYAMSLVKGAPHGNAGRLWFNFLMTEASQVRFAEAFLRPAVPGLALPAPWAERLPAAAQLRPLDVVKAAARKAEIDAAWMQAARP